ncbi:uncharacterized protein [Diadema setosum]|uniref:uncharacterized protein n=1 Tax=Diadema setosum TaxID=31175 RepID=UPI003B3A1D98
MDDDERKKKLLAGRERLAKFQKQKSSPEKKAKKKKKKKPAAEQGGEGQEGVNGDSDVTSGRLSDDSSYGQVDSSFASDFSSPLHSEDSDSHLDGDISSSQNNASAERILFLEESLEGKEMALQMMQEELEEAKHSLAQEHSRSEALQAQLQQNGDSPGTPAPLSSGEPGDGTWQSARVHTPEPLTPDREEEYKEAIRQYNLKIMEFQGALGQRDDIIKQLSDNLQGALQSRDEVQQEAASQASQLSEHIQGLQSQLRIAGETLQSQGKTEMAELAEELTQAHNHVVNLRQTIADKDELMHQLANRYTKKAQELVELSEEKEGILRQHAGEMADLQQQVADLRGDSGSLSREQRMDLLRGELDESYGKQMMLMKEQMAESHQQEVELLQQRCNELQVLARTNADFSDREIKDLQKQLEERDAAIIGKEREAGQLQQQLEKLVNEFARQNDELEQKHATDVNILKAEAEREMKVMRDEFENEKERERLVVEDLTDRLQQAVNDNRELTEIRDTYEGQITRLMSQLEETQHAADSSPNSLQSREQDAEEIARLRNQLDNLQQDNQTLHESKKASEEQIASLTAQMKHSSLEADAAINKLSEERDESLAQQEDKIQQLQQELEELRVSGPSFEKLEEIRKNLEAEIKQNYDDMMEDLRYSHEADLKKLKVQLDVEYGDKLKDAQKELENQIDQRVKKVQTEKEHEFVAELQNVRGQLKEQYEEELKHQLEREREKMMEEKQAVDEQKEAAPQGGVLSALKDDHLAKLQTEVQDLSEVRDDLLVQLEVANRDQESLRQELAASTFEKENLNAQVGRLNEELLGIQFQTDMTVDSPFYDNERDDLNEKLQVLNSKLQSQEQDHEIEVSGYAAKIEALKQQLVEATLAHEQEKEELDGKIQELKSVLEGHTEAIGQGQSQNTQAGDSTDGAGDSSNLVAEMNRMQNDLAVAKKVVEEYSSKLESLESANQSLGDHVKQLTEQLDERGCEVERMQCEKANVEEQLAEVQVALEELKVRQPDEESMVNAEEQIKRIEEEKKGIEDILEKTQSQIAVLREEVEQSDSKIHDLIEEVSRQAVERNELEDNLAKLEGERDQLLSEKEALQHQLELEQKERDCEVGELKSQLDSLSQSESNEDRDSAIGMLEALTSRQQSRCQELELQVTSLEEELVRQQSVQLVKDVEIMAQQETFEEAVANYDRLLGQLRAEKEELRVELERTAVSVDDPDGKITTEVHEEVIAETVAPVAAASSPPTMDHEETDLREALADIDSLKSVNEKLKGELLNVSAENDALQEEKCQLRKDLDALKQILQEGEEEKGNLEDMIENADLKVKELETLVSDLENDNQRLQDTFNQQLSQTDNQQETTPELKEEIASLKAQIAEHQELYKRENKLLQQALQEERDTTARLLEEGDSPTSRDALLQEIIDLKKSLAHKDQTEHEILTEKNRQIGVLQDSNAKLLQEKEDLSSKVNDLERRMQAAEAISQEVQDTFGKQFTELQVEQNSLREQLDEQKRKNGDRPEGSQSLDEQALREEALRCAKDMLLQKLEEKEAVEQHLLEEKLELQKRLEEQQRLEELLHEKDRLEQELARQKRSLQAEVKDMEQKLQERERQLQHEKTGLETELQQKDFELRKWEANFREQQLEYRNRQAFVKRRHDNELDYLRTESDKEMVARLEGMRLILEKQHAEAVARLRQDLEQEFDAREAREAERHLSDISLLKSRHLSQLEELRAEWEARLGAAKEELEEERKKQISVVKSAHERMLDQEQIDHQQTLKELKDQHEWEMEALKGQLDVRQQEIFAEMKAKLEEAHQTEKEAIRQQCQARAQQELDSVKSTLEQLYAGQTDAIRAELALEQAQALSELRQTLTLANQEAMSELEEVWKARLEEERKEVASKTDEAVQNSEELITQLQRRLSQEHREVVQTLAEQWDQEAVEKLETLRTEMEAKYSQELEEEKNTAEGRREQDLQEMRDRMEEEHREDVDLLLKEREMLVEHAEEMRQNLDRVHHEDLAKLRASLKAEYDQYVRAREELEISRSQSEASLIEELSLLKIAHQDLQQEYRAEVANLKEQLEQAGVSDPDQLKEENKELQAALTSQRAKLQQEHAEELEQLRVYFEKQVEETDERWKQEMAQLKSLYESPRGTGSQPSDEKEAKRMDYSHAMMTLTHLSDSDSSPPRSPPKFLEVEAELKQELRAQLEQEYHKGIRNLRQELESEHQAEMARVKMEYDLQRDEDLQKQEERLKAKHTQDINDMELEHLNKFEQLRNELDAYHTKEIARLRLEAVAESSRAVEEERGRWKVEHEDALRNQRKEMEEEHARENQEMRMEMSSELAAAVAEEMERLRETLQEEHLEELDNMRKDLTEKYESQLETLKLDHAIEIEKLQRPPRDENVEADIAKMNEQWRSEREMIIKASKNEVVDEVAKIVSDATIERALLQVEIDTQANMMGVCLEEIDKLKTTLAEAEAANQLQSLHSSGFEDPDSLIEQLKAELEESRQQLQQLKEGVASGEAPEVQSLKETLMRDYDNRLDLITTTMNEEMDQLVKTTQQENQADLEKVEEAFASQHQAQMDRFLEDQEKALEEIKAEHQQDLLRAKEDLEQEHLKKQAEVLDELRSSLNSAKEAELEELQKGHALELDQLRLDLMKMTDEERERLEEKMMEERRGVEEVENKMKDLLEAHEREKEMLKARLDEEHEEHVKRVTAEMEDQFKRELEKSNTSVRENLEGDHTKKVSELETALKEMAAQHEDEMNGLRKTHEMKMARLREEHDEQVAAVGATQEADLETAKAELEEAHRKEIIDLTNQLEAQKQKDIEELQSAFEEAKKAMEENHQRALELMAAEHTRGLKDFQQKTEDTLNDLREQMNQSIELEKGELDQRMREREDKWKEEKGALSEENNQLREENASLLQRAEEREAVIGRLERENEEGRTLLAMLRADLDRLGAERNNLQHTNNHLLRVLTTVVQAAMETENAINRRMGPHSRQGPSRQALDMDRRGDGRPSSPRAERPRGAVGGDTSSDGDVLHDTSVGSILSDEGLELSQHINESMFVGPDLDSEGEEIVTGATTRLHSAVERLLDHFSDSSTQSDGLRPVQAEGYASSPSSREGEDTVSTGTGDQEELVHRLQAEIREKERLALELHKSEGLLNGITAEKAEVQEGLELLKERYREMMVQMETQREQLAQVTQANQSLQDAQEQFEQQRAVLAERLGLEDLGLIEENTQLRQQIQSLTQEHQDLEQQALKSRAFLEQQLHALEASTEEQLGAARQREEEVRLRAEDLQRQVDAAKKQQSSHKQFLEQQSADREQEREEFQREIARLEEELRQKEKPGGVDTEQLLKDIQDLKEEISQNQDVAVAAGNRIQQLEKEVSWKQDTVQELHRQIKELERQADEQKEVQSKTAELEAELRSQRHVEEELRHEKDALQKQCYDQLLQVSALQSKLDAHKHGLDGQPADQPTASKTIDDTNEGPMSLAQQWERDKEALDRKDTEIQDLVEQLEQFREDLLNKEEEIAQLQLQLEVASREQGSGREDLEEEINQVKAENERLKDELHSAPLSPSEEADQDQCSLPQLAQDLLEEKNLEIDQLTEQVQSLQKELEGKKRTKVGMSYSREEVVEEVIRVERRSREATPNAPEVGVTPEELDALRLTLEREIAEKDREIGQLRQQIEEGDGKEALSKPAVVEALDRMKRDAALEQEQKMQLEQEVSSLRQMMVIREREVAQLEAQLVRSQEQSLSNDHAQADTNNLRQMVEEKDLEIVDLKLQIDRLEEAVFQAQQSAVRAREQEEEQTQTSPPQEMPIATAVALEEAERKRGVLEETVRRLEGELDQERRRASEMEADYQRRVAGLHGLSPGKTLEQKLNEIREELTQQHQQHVADIQRTMAKEAELRIEQLRLEHQHQLELLEERHQGQVHEAVLRTNRDLMAAHGEEKARIEEEHRKQMDRLASAAAATVGTPGTVGSPGNASSMGDVANLLHKEVENTARLDSNLLGHLRRRQGGVGREQSPGEGAMTNGDASELDTSNGEIPPRLQSVLARLHSEGLQVLSLSDLRYLRQATSPLPSVRRGTDVASLQSAWQNEKQALLDAIQALKDLITQTTAGLTTDESDWRGDLLRAIQAVFDQERESLLSELRTHVVASGDQDLSQVQLLERRIREQESHHKAAMEQIYGADRSSLLAEVHDLRMSHNATRIELQEVRQKSTQQLSALEEQSSNREKQLKRQLETMEHKFRQERILADDLRTSLTVERQKLSQLGAALANEKKLVSDLRDEIADLQALLDRVHVQRDDFERRVVDVASVAESALAALEAEKVRSSSLTESLESEKRNVAKLHEALALEAERSSQGRDRDQKLAKELRRELEAERQKSAEIGRSLEGAKQRAENLGRELEAERMQSANTSSSEKMRTVELKRALDVEKTRCQEMHTALQREQTLNAQLHENLEQERRTFAEDSLRDKSAVADLQSLLDAERRKAVDLHAAIQELEGQRGRLEGALHSERSQGSGAVEREKAVTRKLKESVENLNSQCRDLSNKLAAEQEAASKAQAECDQLRASLTSQKERELDEEARRETEKEAERQRAKEWQKEKENEKQRQRDRTLERQLDRQKMDALEDELTESQRTVKQLRRENARLKDSQQTTTETHIHRSVEVESSSESKGSYRRREGTPTNSERASLDLYKGQLESVRQRLQLMAVKQQEELARVERATVGVDSIPLTTVQDLRSAEGGLTELITELKQIHAALTLLSESQPPLVTLTASRINEKLLQQNAEMSLYVSQLSSEKSELRGALSRLEEEIWQYRQREVQRHQSPRTIPGDQDTEAALGRERAAWAQERLATQNSLLEAERQIAQLKLDLERGAVRRETTVNGETIEQQQQQKIQRLYGKYLRAESFRKALVYQKKYLLLLLGGFQDCEQATLSLIAKMGAYPSPEDLRDHPSRHNKAFTRFRSAARVVVAISRLKFLVKKWRRATKAGSREIIGSAGSSQGHSQPHPNPSLSPNPSPTTYSAGASPGSAGRPSPTALPHRYTSPLRATPRAGDSPPVRDRLAYGMMNGMVTGSAAGSRGTGRSPVSHRHGASPFPDAMSGSARRDVYGDRLGASASVDAALNESDGSYYIRKIESLQERLGAMAGRKATLGHDQGSSRLGYSNR